MKWAVADQVSFRLKRYVWLRFGYVGLLSAAGIVSQIMSVGINSTVITDIVTAVLTLGINAIFWLIAKSKSSKVHFATALAIVALDTFVATFVIYTHGGIESRSFVLFAVPVLASAILFGRKTSFVTAAFCSLVYDLMLIAQWQLAIPRPGAIFTNLHLDGGFLLQTVVFYNAALFMIALVTNFATRLVEESQGALTRQQARSTQAEHIAHLGSWEWDVANNKVNWSGELCAIFGLTPDKAPADYVATMAFFVPADRMKLDSAVRAALQYQEPYKLNLQFKRSDGAVRVLHAEGRAVTGEDGKVVKLVGTGQDVTEQQTVQGQLEKRGKELEQTREAILNVLGDLEKEKKTIEQERVKDSALLTSLGEGLIVIDAEGKIIKVNPTALSLLGYAEKDLIGQWFPRALPIFDDKGVEVPPLDRPVVQALSSGEAITRAVIHKKKDGQTFPSQVTVSPFVVEGKPAGAIVVFRDITKEKQLEKAKDEFLSIASHELRTPMGAIRAMVSMILGGDYGPVNDDLKEPLTDIRSSTLRLVSLVNDLLNVARIEAGRLLFTLTEFDARSIVKEATELLMPLGKEKNVLVAADRMDEALVQGDLDKVKQVITNLMGNSLKFTDKGSIKVSVTKFADHAEFDVVDTGMGISKEDQAKLFGKFQQITSAQTGKPQGTGLGLYISRELIRKMGGELWIKSSEVGKGSTFAFTLPLAGSMMAKKAQGIIASEAKEHPDQK